MFLEDSAVPEDFIIYECRSLFGFPLIGRCDIDLCDAHAHCIFNPDRSERPCVKNIAEYTWYSGGARDRIEWLQRGRKQILSFS
jgi:hypothetical protein